MSQPQYSITYKRSVTKALRRIEHKYQQAIVTAIEELALQPRPDGVKKLKGGEGEYRLRVGPYRVIYDINDGELLILVLHAGHRKNAYEKF